MDKIDKKLAEEYQDFLRELDAIEADYKIHGGLTLEQIKTKHNLI